MSCNNLGEPSANDFKEGVSQIAQALGTKSCSTSSDITQFSLGGNAYVNTPFGDAGMGFQQSYSDSLTDTVGCEQLAIASNQFAAATKKISCLITKDSSNINVTTLNTNTIEIASGRDLTAEDIKIDQKINVKVVSTANLSSNTKKAISDEVKNTALTTIGAVQESKSGMGATPQGSKVVTDAKTKIENLSFTNITDETIKNVSVTTTSANTIKITAGRDINFKKKFEATQDIAADIAATAILSNAMTTALESVTTNLNETKMELKQKAENLGADTLGRQAAEGLALVTKAQRESQYGTFSTIAAVIVVVIVAIVILKKATGGGGGGGGGAGTGGTVPATGGGFGKIALVIIGAVIGGIGVATTAKAKQAYSQEEYDRKYVEKVKTAETQLKACMDDPIITKKEECPTPNIKYNYEDDYGGKYKTAHFTLIAFICLCVISGLVMLVWLYPWVRKLLGKK